MLARIEEDPGPDRPGATWHEYPLEWTRRVKVLLIGIGIMLFGAPLFFIGGG